MRTLPLYMALLGMAGCDATWPYNRIGTWRPTGVADANIAASVVNPTDLVRGVEYTPHDSTTVTASIERYRTGRVRALPDANSFSLRTPGATAAGGDSGAPATGGTAAAAQ